MPHRPLPPGFAEAIQSIQRARSEKRERKQHQVSELPEELSGTDTEKESEVATEHQQPPDSKQLRRASRKRHGEDRRRENIRIS